MKIAIPIMDNDGIKSIISEHFGHAEYFAFIDIFDNNYDLKIVKNPMVDSHSPGQIPNYMKEKAVDTMIVRGIGGRAIQFFSDLGISIYRGASGNIEDIVEKFISGNIVDKDYEVKDKHYHK